MRALFCLLLLFSFCTVFASPSGGAQDDNPIVIPEPDTPEVARDVGVADLPLLDTEPAPTGGQDQPTIPDPVIGGADSTFNPFAPLTLPQQPTAPPAATETPETPAPESPVPETETVPQTPPSAPTLPRAPVPEVQVARPTIPNSLISGMTPPSVAIPNPTPGPLEATIGSQTTSPNDLNSTGIAVRTPVPPPLIAAPAMAGTTRSVTRTVAAAPGSPQGVTPLTFAGTMLGYDENATSAVSNRVSRALGNLRVSFTAMSTGTGVFRVGNSTRPVLLVVGDTLPGTQLTLSRLTARSAQFVEDDVRHTLLLNP